MNKSRTNPSTVVYYNQKTRIVTVVSPKESVSMGNMKLGAAFDIARRATGLTSLRSNQ